MWAGCLLHLLPSVGLQAHAPTSVYAVLRTQTQDSTDTRQALLQTELHFQPSTLGSEAVFESHTHRVYFTNLKATHFTEPW